MLCFEHAVLERLSRCRDAPLFPRVLPTRDGRPLGHVAGADGTHHFVRMVTLLPGAVLADVASPGPELLRDIGCTLGKLHTVLACVRHPAMVRFFQWDAAH